MVQIKVTVKNGIEVPMFLESLPTKLQEFILSNSEIYMSELRKAMKVRMPRETGFMSNRIFIDKTKQGFLITVDTPYAAAQEFGFEPHVIPIEYIQGHLNSRTQGTYVRKPKGFVKVSKNTPFVAPSLNATNSTFNELMSSAVNKAIRSKK